MGPGRWLASSVPDTGGRANGLNIGPIAGPTTKLPEPRRDNGSRIDSLQLLDLGFCSSQIKSADLAPLARAGGENITWPTRILVGRWIYTKLVLLKLVAKTNGEVNDVAHSLVIKRSC